MIDEDIPCDEILVQVNAVKSALHKVGQIIMVGHINNCVKDGIRNGDADKTLQDFAKVLEQYSKIRSVRNRSAIYPHRVLYHIPHTGISVIPRA